MSVPTTQCPTDEALLAFGRGRIDPAIGDTIRTHLDGCRSCQDRARALVAGYSTARGRGDTAASQSDSGGATNYLPHPGAAAAVGRPTESVADALARLPDYECVEEIGRGGMGVVYKARQKFLNREVVLKVADPNLTSDPGVVKRFLLEMEAVAKLNHTNVAAAYAAMQVGRLLVFVMEYVPGQNLEEIAVTRGPLPVAEACMYVYYAAKGLQHAHDRKLAHRDIKPANLMVTKVDGRRTVKVLDFGLAKISAGARESAALTAVGSMMGTPLYMAPEQATDAGTADIRADVYSLGCTLYRLIAGHPPFTPRSLVDLLLAHRHDAAVPLDRVRADVPAELVVAVQRMMAKNPADRFQTPGEVTRALAPFFKPSAKSGVGGPQGFVPVDPHFRSYHAQTAGPQPGTVIPSPTSSRTGPPPLPTTDRGSRKWLMLGGLVAVLVAAGVGIMLATQGGKSDTPSPPTTDVREPIPPVRPMAYGVIEVGPSEVRGLVADVAVRYGVTHLEDQPNLPIHPRRLTHRPGQATFDPGSAGQVVEAVGELLDEMTKRGAQRQNISVVIGSGVEQLAPSVVRKACVTQLQKEIVARVGADVPVGPVKVVQEAKYMMQEILRQDKLDAVRNPSPDRKSLIGKASVIDIGGGNVKAAYFDPGTGVNGQYTAESLKGTTALIDGTRVFAKSVSEPFDDTLAGRRAFVAKLEAAAKNGLEKSMNSASDEVTEVSTSPVAYVSGDAVRALTRLVRPDADPVAAFVVLDFRTRKDQDLFLKRLTEDGSDAFDPSKRSAVPEVESLLATVRSDAARLARLKKELDGVRTKPEELLAAAVLVRTAVKEFGLYHEREIRFPNDESFDWLASYLVEKASPKSTPAP